jgi:transcriptional regulator with XRE-family HTH domain
MTLMRNLLSRSPVAGLLRDARLQAGMKQSELSARLGVPQSFVSKYETGERRLDFMEVRSICAALGLPLAEFAERVEATQGQNDEGTHGIPK